MNKINYFKTLLLVSSTSLCSCMKDKHLIDPIHNVENLISSSTALTETTPVQKCAQDYTLKLEQK